MALTKKKRRELLDELADSLVDMFETQLVDELQTLDSDYAELEFGSSDEGEQNYLDLTKLVKKKLF